MTDNNKSLGKILKQRRVTLLLTQGELSAKSGVSPSHLARIERGERFPSAQVLRKIANPLSFSESELFTFAGYLRSQPLSVAHSLRGGQLDPYVATVLSQEPVETQRAVVAILGVLKSMAKSIGQENSGTKAQ